MAENSKDNVKEDPSARRVISACPHCGSELSPWQQILLSIDRALVCRHCWYRIILDISEVEENSSIPKNKE